MNDLVTPLAQHTVLLEKSPACITVCNRGELGQALFRAGFRDQSRAGLFVDALWCVSPTGSRLSVENQPDRVAIDFNYLRNYDLGVDKGTTLRMNYIHADSALNSLRRKLQLLCVPFTLEVGEAPVGCVSTLRLVLIKQQVLALLNEHDVWVTRRPNDWSAVKEEIAGLAEHACLRDATSAYEIEMAVAGEIYCAPKPKLDLIAIEDFWNYHSARFTVPTAYLITRPMFKLVKSYHQLAHQRFRFIIVHGSEGMSEVQVLRKTKVE